MKKIIMVALFTMLATSVFAYDNAEDFEYNNETAIIALYETPDMIMFMVVSPSSFTVIIDGEYEAGEQENNGTMFVQNFVIYGEYTLEVIE